MNTTAYDMTYTDLNPKYLFSFKRIQTYEEAEEDHIQEKDEERNRCHDFVELVIIMKGRGRFFIDGQEYPVEEGNVLLLNPGTWHYSLPEKGKQKGATEFYLAFTDVEYKNCPKGFLPLFHNYKIMTMLPEAAKKDIFYLCNAIEKEANSCETGRYFMMKAYLIQVLCLLERFQKQERELEQKHLDKKLIGCEFKSVNKQYVVQRIMDYMENHYQEKISLDQIAANMYLSSYYISKIFKSETGDTPINFLISLRMKKAREMLDAEEKFSIQEVAAAVGYEDAYHFSKLFKKYYGLSPLYYRARLR